MTARRPPGRATPAPGDGQGGDTPAVLTKVVSELEANAHLDAWALRVQRLGAALDTGQIGRILEGRWLGHALHPLLTDLPLGCWLSAGILDLVGGRAAAPATQRLVGVGLLTVPGTVAAGLLDASRLDDRRAIRVSAIHAAGNVLVATGYLCSWNARRRGFSGAGKVWGMVAGVLAIGTGYLGGHLSFARGAGVEPRGIP